MHRIGVLLGCDHKQEWLLPWWWGHYAAHNAYPVAFANFGMSPQARAWCLERGECFSISSDHIPSGKRIPKTERQRWEKRYGKGIWFCRSAWFQKPLALLHSPFEITLWLDLDCQVNGSLEPLFHCLNMGGEIGLVKEPDFIEAYEREQGFLLPKEVHYNSGVIIARKGADILNHWVYEATRNAASYAGDQQALCRAIFLHRPAVIELPSVYNWLRILGPNPQALIYHYTGGQGKIEILKRVNPTLIPD